MQPDMHFAYIYVPYLVSAYIVYIVPSRELQNKDLRCAYYYSVVDANKQTKNINIFILQTCTQPDL
jgi:hypothetical protein